MTHAKPPATGAAIQYRAPRDDAELSALDDILAQSLHFPRAWADVYAQIVGRANHRIITAGETLAGGLAILPMGQFFGGKRVEMAGIAAVGVAPEQRSRGVATRLMQEIIRELHGRGCAISTLYPATLPLYRRVGYELAGARFEIRVPVRAIGVRERDMHLRPILPADEAVIAALYAEHARLSPGHLDRHEFSWRRTRELRGQKAHGYIVTNPDGGAIEGWVRFLQKDAERSKFSLHVTDVLATTPAAGRALLSFFGDHRSLADEVIFFGSPYHPLLKLLPELAVSFMRAEQWMVRIVDVSAALSQRGYRQAVAAELHLDIEDDLIAANSGRYVLRVRDGEGAVESGGRGDVKIDIRGLAALYTGHASPRDLVSAGQIEPARDERTAAALEAAETIFAGAAPWMPDMF